MDIKLNRDYTGGLIKTKGDPYASHKFGLEIDGVTINGVHKLDGIEFESEVIEYNDGEDPVTHCRPGTFKPGRMIVERDHTNDKAFFNWRKAVVEGKVDRRSISVTFHNDKGEESKRLNFFHCFPTKWWGPSLNSHSSEHASEKVEIVFEEMKIA